VPSHGSKRKKDQVLDISNSDEEHFPTIPSHDPNEEVNEKENDIFDDKTSSKKVKDWVSKLSRQREKDGKQRHSFKKARIQEKEQIESNFKDFPEKASKDKRLSTAAKQYIEKLFLQERYPDSKRIAERHFKNTYHQTTVSKYVQTLRTKLFDKLREITKKYVSSFFFFIKVFFKNF
jgi:hypothetical protein